MEALKFKRKRTPNFTAEEKLRFVRLLREEGKSIVSKVTSHDLATNKEKELAWKKITNMHNSGGDLARTTETLKKQWGKLKSDAKIFKSTYKHSVSGTGGGPFKNFDDPVLELVVEMTGRASTGVKNVNDCDAVVDKTLSEEEDEETEDGHFARASPTIEYLDESILREDFPEDKIMVIPLEDEDDYTTAQANAAIVNIKKRYLSEKGAEKEAEAAVNKITILKKTNKENVIDNKEKERANRRRPEINVPNERTEKIQNHQRISNRFAAERLRAEQEKTNLIIQQKMYTELHKKKMEKHNIKIENEKLKQELLKTLLKKVSDADSKDFVTAIQDVLNTE